MIYILKNDLNNINYVPFDKYDGIRKTLEQANADGFYIDTLPTPLNNGKGYTKRLAGTPKPLLNENDVETAKYNSILIEYDYYDLETTQEELYRQKIDSLELAIAELSMMVAGQQVI